LTEAAVFWSTKAPIKWKPQSLNPEAALTGQFKRVAISRLLLSAYVYLAIDYFGIFLLPAIDILQQKYTDVAASFFS
jgi:hypothetical protein